MRFKGTTKTIREIARELPADAFVTGSWQRAGGRVRVTAQLINASTERNVWAMAYDRDNTDVLKLEAEVAQDIASEINTQVTPEENKRLSSAKTVNPAAHDEFLLGQYLTVWTRSGPITGVVARRAIHLMTSEERNKVPQFTDVWVDIGARDGKEARELVTHGDSVTFALGYRPMRNGMAVG